MSEETEQGTVDPGSKTGGYPLEGGGTNLAETEPPPVNKDEPKAGYPTNG